MNSVSELKSKISDLEKQVLELREENKRLLECQKENWMIESMNDMRDSNKKLEEKCNKLKDSLLDTQTEMYSRVTRENHNRVRSELLELKKKQLGLGSILITFRENIQKDSNLDVTSRYSYKVILNFIISMLG